MGCTVPVGTVAQCSSKSALWVGLGAVITYCTVVITLRDERTLEIEPAARKQTLADPRQFYGGMRRGYPLSAKCPKCDPCIPKQVWERPQLKPCRAAVHHCIAQEAILSPVGLRSHSVEGSFIGLVL